MHDHFILDESAALYGFTVLTTGKDPILADLAGRLLNRRLFAYTTIHNDEDIDAIRTEVALRGYDTEYYLACDQAYQRPYQPYKAGDGHNIWVICEDDSVKELSEISDIVSAIVRGKSKEDKKAFYPEV